MQPVARLLAAAIALFAQPALAQQAADPVPSQCMAIAQSLPRATYASFTPAPLKTQAATGDGEVTITYAGHATYVIETPAGVRIATDYSGAYGSDPLPRIVTMNKAHSMHHTFYPDPGIAFPLPGWGDGTTPAKHALVVDDVYVRNVPTDIRSYGGGMEVGGNSIFIFEVAGLCIGHLGHLHHHLEDAHYAAIGRLDIVMVPVDGGMTLSAGAMTDIVKRLFASIVLPMHRNWTPLSEFTSRMSDSFALDFRQERSLTVSLRTLPRRPTVIVLEGV
ncbi:MAG: MBL fold metallo-hydrolase [Rhizobiaceae bacterium]|nr:MBL fold metallo-hydrolase [Rhizobiaceae bacterium]